MFDYNYIKIQVEEIFNTINQGQRNSKLVLYPFGKQGMLIKQILNWQYGVQEAFILDEGLCGKNPNIKSLSYLNDIDTSQYTFIITSDNLECWDEIRQNIKKYVKDENILDIYSPKPCKYKDSRIASLELAAREIYDKGIKGACAEAGVYQGDFSSHINEFFYDRKLYLFDTFEGFSDKDMKLAEKEDYTYKGYYYKCVKNTSEDIVLNKMLYKDNVVLRKGWFPDTVQGLEEEFCFVSLDMDLYQPIKAGLEYFYPRLSRGGYIFIHDCNISRHVFKGPRIALLEFTERENIGYVMLSDNLTAVITK